MRFLMDDESDDRIAGMGIELVRWNMAACLESRRELSCQRVERSNSKELAADSAPSLEIWRDEHLS